MPWEQTMKQAATPTRRDLRVVSSNDAQSRETVRVPARQEARSVYREQVACDLMRDPRYER
jgi:hypothetical protein